jgi:hypothetical protein
MIICAQFRKCGKALKIAKKIRRNFEVFLDFLKKL